MARYIDADELLKELQEELDFETPMYTEEQNKYFNSGLRCAIRDVKKAPTADVVPKSEVERLETVIKVLTENSISAKYPCHVSCSKGLILTKSLEEYDKLLADIASEVAREIFEEIEDVLNNIGYFDEIDFKALKKKYTESEDKP